MAELVPVALELVSVAVNKLSGQTTTIFPALLGKPTAAATLPTREQNGELLTIAKSLTKMDKRTKRN